LPKIQNPEKTLAMKYRPKYLGTRYPYSVASDIFFIGAIWIGIILWAIAGLKWLFHLFF